MNTDTHTHTHRHTHRHTNTRTHTQARHTHTHTHRHFIYTHTHLHRHATHHTHTHTHTQRHTTHSDTQIHLLFCTSLCITLSSTAEHRTPDMCLVFSPRLCSVSLSIPCLETSDRRHELYSANRCSFIPDWSLTVSLIHLSLQNAIWR